MVQVLRVHTGTERTPPTQALPNHSHTDRMTVTHIRHSNGQRQDSHTFIRRYGDQAKQLAGAFTTHYYEIFDTDRNGLTNSSEDTDIQQRINTLTHWNVIV